VTSSSSILTLNGSCPWAIIPLPIGEGAYVLIKPYGTVKPNTKTDMLVRIIEEK
jgi:hypothetical protein